MTRVVLFATGVALPSLAAGLTIAARALIARLAGVDVLADCGGDEGDTNA